MKLLKVGSVIVVGLFIIIFLYFLSVIWINNHISSRVEELVKNRVIEDSGESIGIRIVWLDNSVIGLESDLVELERVTKLLRAIGKVESEMNVGSLNRKEGARGFLQIRKVMVDEANQILKKRGDSLRYSPDCVYDPLVSLRIWFLVQNKYNPKMNIEEAIKIWNGGPRWREKDSIIQEKLDIYYQKVLREYE